MSLLTLILHTIISITLKQKNFVRMADLSSNVSAKGGLRCGGGGIRTREPFTAHAFQACGMNHYPTPPLIMGDEPLPRHAVALAKAGPTPPRRQNT